MANIMEGKTEKVLGSASGSQIDSEDLVDNISNLPDPILSHILSFLTTKQSVSTSILSQRWKFIWRMVSNFDFCNVETLEVFEDADDESKINWNLRDRQIDSHLVKFVQFVNKVFLLRTAGSINNFSLAYEAQSISSDVNNWINTTIDNNVQNLFLNIYVGNLALAYEPPSRIFSCESLRSLDLKCNCFFNVANVVSLPRLEILQLYSIRYQDEEAFKKLILGCPVLKCLCVTTYFIDYKDPDEDTDEGTDEDTDEDEDEYMREYDKNVFNFMVYSTSLRRLELQVEGQLSDTFYCSLELEAPSLQVIKLKNCISRLFLHGSLSSLDEVHFEINAFVIGGDHILEYSCDYVVEALRAFSCAKALTLSNHVLQALTSADISLNTDFKRLKKFWIMADYPFWDTLQDSMEFIQCSDSLEHIIFDKRLYSELEGKGIGWEIPKQVPKCLTNSVKIVLFYAFEGYKDEMEMVEYLLKHGNALLIVHIHVRVEPCYQGYKKKFEMLQQISKFSRKSPACQLHFV